MAKRKFFYEVFVDEGPVSGRLKRRFLTKQSAVKRAKATTDGKWTVYEIDDEFNERVVARGSGNPGPKLQKVQKTTGWIKATAVRFVKRGGRTEVFLKQ